METSDISWKFAWRCIFYSYLFLIGPWSVWTCEMRDEKRFLCPVRLRMRWSSLGRQYPRPFPAFWHQFKRKSDDSFVVCEEWLSFLRLPSKTVEYCSSCKAKRYLVQNGLFTNAQGCIWLAATIYFDERGDALAWTDHCFLHVRR